MGKIQMPEGYQTVMPYLILDKANEFFDFTKNVFEATEKVKHLANDGGLIHGEVTIGGSTIMFGNASKEWPVQNAGLYVNVEDADKIFRKAIDHGAAVIQEVRNQPYGRSGGVKDPFGNTWWITSQLKN